MKIFKYIYTFLALSIAMKSVAQQPFTPGNIVVYRVGDGSATLTLAFEKVYLDEYTSTGTLVQSIQMPATGKRLTMIGRNDGGYLTLSANGKYLVVPGWDVDPGVVPTTISGLNRSLGLVDFNGEVTNVTVVTNNPGTTQIASVTTDDGSNYWIGGGNRIDYVTGGSSTATSIATLTAISSGVAISEGQLYAATSSITQPIIKVGNGLPTTSGQTLTPIPGLPDRTNPRQFAFADLDPTVPGMDVLYLASQSSTVGGLQKYSLVNGTWVLNGVLGTTTDFYAGLTIQITANAVTIFATRKGNNSTLVKGGELVSLIDNSGYNGTFSGTPTVLASAPSVDTKAFRGIAVVPQRAPFTPGNIVTYRVGDGTTTLGSAMAKVYVDEYTPSGSLVQSILMPTTGKKISMLGFSNNGGFMSLSADGKYLVVPGWDVDKDLAPSTVVGLNRSIGLVDFNSNVNSVTVIENNPANSQPSGATSADGTGLWLSGARIEYVPTGGTSATIVANFTVQSLGLAISEGQLYAGSTNRTTPLIKVGNGLPTTTGNAVTTIPGLPDRTSPRQFAFADMEPSVPGVDVLYLSSISGTTGGLQKYSLVNSTWVFNGVVGTPADNYGGLTIKVAANTVTIFATRQGANSSTIQGGELVSLVDNSGYNGALTGTPTVLVSVTAANTKSFRGLANVPVGCPPVTALRVPDISSSQANISWNTPVLPVSGYEYAVTTSIAPPASGTFTTATSASVNGLTDATTYYVHVRAACSATSNSEWTTISFLTGCQAPARPQVKINLDAAGVLTARWNKVFGAADYEYNITTNAMPPASGAAIPDTFFVNSNLNSITQYYLHVRSSCGSGSFSSWVTTPFTTGCFMPATHVSVLPKKAGISWTKIPGAVKFEYIVTYSPAKPLSGIYTTDTVYTLNKTEEGTAYHFHVRSVCANGSVSEWSTASFNSYGLKVYPNPVKDLFQIKVEGIGNPSGEISIGDAMGRVIRRFQLNNSSLTVNTIGWAPGVYLVRYDDGKNKYTVRIVKQ